MIEISVVPVPEDLRLVTNGFRWRVQRRRRFLWWTWWSVVHWTSKAYPDMDYCDFSNADEARDAMTTLVESMQAERGEWRVTT